MVDQNTARLNRLKRLLNQRSETEAPYRSKKAQSLLGMYSRPVQPLLDQQFAATKKIYEEDNIPQLHLA